MRNAIIKKFEELGFTVDKDKQGYQVQQYTPAGLKRKLVLVLYRVFK